MSSARSFRPRKTYEIGIVVAGHGSRNSDAILEFREQMRLFVEFQKGIQKGIIEYGFLEFETPGIGEAIDCAIKRGAKRVFVLPAMLTAAHHVKTDIPNIIRIAQQKHPLIPICYGRHLDLHPKIVDLCKNRIQQALSEWASVDSREILLIVVGRGSSDVAGNKDVITLTRLLGQVFHFGDARYSYTSVAEPLFKDAMEATDATYRAILILPYLLFSGVLAHKIGESVRQFRENNPNILVKLAESLGPDILVADALLDRLNEAILLEEQEKTDDNKENGKDTA